MKYKLSVYWNLFMYDKVYHYRLRFANHGRFVEICDFDDILECSDYCYNFGVLPVPSNAARWQYKSEAIRSKTILEEQYRKARLPVPQIEVVKFAGDFFVLEKEKSFFGRILEKILG